MLLWISSETEGKSEIFVNPTETQKNSHRTFNRFYYVLEQYANNSCKKQELQICWYILLVNQIDIGSLQRYWYQKAGS